MSTKVQLHVGYHLYLRPPSQNPVLLNSHTYTNSVFLLSRKWLAPLTDTLLRELPLYLKKTTPDRRLEFPNTTLRACWTRITQDRYAYMLKNELGPSCAPSFFKSRRFGIPNTTKKTILLYAKEFKVPPWAPTSGPEPCGGNKALKIYTLYNDTHADVTYR